MSKINEHFGKQVQCGARLEGPPGPPGEPGDCGDYGHRGNTGRRGSPGDDGGYCQCPSRDGMA
ncbi:hypothetical protein KIN20_027145 [Parelaphostrongylus tenuis]|uniref:Uncharacterized protein n=1 Tax=Parelaphostrongylus tenuis TaxID=148309 RepID=A0AAD5WDL0_PARTN|nr:hypothetical protein KIN20_027145 [Parelaphostrongylus tenuis]